jgi:hypothetical protein
MSSEKLNSIEIEAPQHIAEKVHASLAQHIVMATEQLRKANRRAIQFSTFDVPDAMRIEPEMDTQERWQTFYAQHNIVLATVIDGPKSSSDLREAIKHDNSTHHLYNQAINWESNVGPAATTVTRLNKNLAVAETVYLASTEDEDRQKPLQISLQLWAGDSEQVAEFFREHSVVEDLKAA